MNIFYLHNNPRKCAQMHCDKHVVKMIVETAQMLCTTHHLNNSIAPYKATHINHPCNIWCRESLDNYNWLCQLGLELCKEYTKRYNKVHKTQQVIEWCISHKPQITSSGLTRRPLAMPDKYKGDNPINSYRQYYIGEKLHFIKYKNGNIPSWIKPYICVTGK